MIRGTDRLAEIFSSIIINLILIRQFLIRHFPLGTHISIGDLRYVSHYSTRWKGFSSNGTHRLFRSSTQANILYKTWLKKGFIAAIRGYYLQSASTHKEHRQQHLAAFRQTLLDPLLIPSIPTSTIINCNILIDLRLLPMPIQVCIEKRRSAANTNHRLFIYWISLFGGSALFDLLIAFAEFLPLSTKTLRKVGSPTKSGSSFRNYHLIRGFSFISFC